MAITLAERGAGCKQKGAKEMLKNPWMDFFSISYGLAARAPS
jgi:hypothetical protein